MRRGRLQATHVKGLTVTEVCVVAAAVVVLGALGVAVALILTVVLLTTSAFAGSGSLWVGKRKTLEITHGCILGFSTDVIN